MSRMLSSNLTHPTKVWQTTRALVYKDNAFHNPRKKNTLWKNTLVYMDHAFNTSKDMHFSWKKIKQWFLKAHHHSPSQTLTFWYRSHLHRSFSFYFILCKFKRGIFRLHTRFDIISCLKSLSSLSLDDCKIVRTQYLIKYRHKRLSMYRIFQSWPNHVSSAICFPLPFNTAHG